VDGNGTALGKLPSPRLLKVRSKLVETAFFPDFAGVALAYAEAWNVLVGGRCPLAPATLPW
jgi:hypothetical protein